MCPPGGAATVSRSLGNGRSTNRDRQTDGGSIPPSSTTGLGTAAQVRTRFGVKWPEAATRVRQAIWGRRQSTRAPAAESLGLSLGVPSARGNQLPEVSVEYESLCDTTNGVERRVERETIDHLSTAVGGVEDVLVMEPAERSALLLVDEAVGVGRAR